MSTKTPRWVQERDLAPLKIIVVRVAVVGFLCMLSTITMAAIGVIVFETAQLLHLPFIVVPCFVSIFFAGFFLIPTSLLRAHHHHLFDIRAVIITTVAYTLGFLAFPLVGLLVGAFMNGPSWHLLVVPVLLAGWCAAVSLVAVRIWRRAGLDNPVRVIRESLLCPCCRYDLIGNATPVCPECGRPFTFEELGLTETEFRQRQLWARAVARADGVAAAPSNE